MHGAMMAIKMKMIRVMLQMMECGQCKCWVHAKCEGLSDEKYQVLSYLPESVEFVCRLVIILFFL